MEIYLDSNATTRPLPAAMEAIAKAMADGYGNPSSSHSRGAAARSALGRSREAIAAFAGGPEGLVLIPTAAEGFH